MENPLKAIDLFAGCGGLSEGLRRAGFNVVAAVEKDSGAATAYRSNHKTTNLICADIRNTSARKLLSVAGLHKGQLDLLAGCPPCQGFSRLPRRNGRLIHDKRNALIKDFTRLVEGILPRAVLLENVPGLARSRGFKKFLSTLRHLGYKPTWDVLNASDFGVPQRRRRLIVMAVQRSEITLPIGTSKRRTVKDAFSTLKHPKVTRDGLHKMVQSNSPDVKKRIALIPKNGGSRQDLPRRQQLKCHSSMTGFHDVYGRMSWNDVSPTITSGCFNPSKGRFVHPSQNRAISMREAALLQSFPKSYRFPINLGITAIARMIGDALPPLFAEKQAKHLAKFLLTPGT